MLAELKTHLCPSIEVRLSGDGSAAALVVADRPVLLKGLGSLDGRSVDTSGGSNLVGRSIGSHAALGLGCGGRVIRSKVLNDYCRPLAIYSAMIRHVRTELTVVLDERARGPAIDGKVRVAIGLVRSRVLDVAC